MGSTVAQGPLHFVWCCKVDVNVKTQSSISQKALKKRSRFASLRIAFEQQAPTLATVLGEIRAAGKSNVLVAPAVFCAEAAEMQELRRSAGEAVRGLQVAWLPGLGAELPAVVGLKRP